MRKKGALQEALKGQNNADLIKQYMKHLKHIYQIAVVKLDDGSKGEILIVNEVIGVDEDEFINGRRTEKSMNKMKVFNSLRGLHAKVIRVRDKNAPDITGVREYVYNADTNKYELKREYVTDDKGNIDYEATKREECEFLAMKIANCIA